MLLDDRDERPGIKFKDADLIGIPIRVMVGKNFSKDGHIEIRTRSTGDTISIPENNVLAKLEAMIADAL